MDFPHLRLFRDIVQQKSLSRGAALNGISQSAASQQLHEMESRLGVTLLDRGTRPFTLTGAGRLYYDLCRDALRRQEKFVAALEAFKREAEGTVRVASIYSVGLSEMTQLQEEFLARFPKAHLAVDYLRPEKVYEAVLSDQADLGLVSYPVPHKELTSIAWREEEMVVAAAPAHPLARKRVLKPADLEGVDFVGFDEDLPIRHEIDRFLREQGVAVRLAMHFDNIQMIKEAVTLGTAVSILPGRVLQAEVAQGRLRTISLSSRLVRPVGIVHRRRKQFSRAAQSFLQLLQEVPAEVLAD